MRLPARKIQGPLNEFPLNLISGNPNKLANTLQIRLNSDKNVGYFHEDMHAFLLRLGYIW